MKVPDVKERYCDVPVNWESDCNVSMLTTRLLRLTVSSKTNVRVSSFMFKVNSNNTGNITSGVKTVLGSAFEAVIGTTALPLRSKANKESNDRKVSVVDVARSA